MMHRFSLAIFLRIAQIDCLEFGSRPELGSSKKIIRDPPIRLLARQSFLLFPPDKFLANFPFSFSRAHSHIVLLIAVYILSSFGFLTR